MVNNLQELLSSRCCDTLALERDFATLNVQMVQEVKNPQLKTILEQHGRALEVERKNLEQIIDKLGSEQPVPVTGGFLSLFGVRTTAPGENLGEEIGHDIVEAHKKFVDNNAWKLVDANDALLEEEVTHFNLGNYTGLIVLAKQCGQFEIANMLQQIIDNESQIRSQLETTLPMILANAGGEGKMAA